MSSADIPWTPSGSTIDELWANNGQSDPIADEVPDMLATLFAMQAQTITRLYDRERLNGGQAIPAVMMGQLQHRMVQNRLHEIFGFAIREFGEAAAHLDAKPWKLNPRELNRDEFVEEVTDTFLFFIEFCVTAGITADELFSTYIRKSAVVITRAENGTH